MRRSTQDKDMMRQDKTLQRQGQRQKTKANTRDDKTR